MTFLDMEKTYTMTNGNGFMYLSYVRLNMTTLSDFLKKNYICLN